MVLKTIPACKLLSKNMLLELIKRWDSILTKFVFLQQRNLQPAAQPPDRPTHQKWKTRENPGLTPFRRQIFHEMICLPFCIFMIFQRPPINNPDQKNKSNQDGWEGEAPDNRKLRAEKNKQNSFKTPTCHIWQVVRVTERRTKNCCFDFIPPFSISFFLTYLISPKKIVQIIGLILSLLVSNKNAI